MERRKLLSVAPDRKSVCTCICVIICVPLWLLEVTCMITLSNSAWNMWLEDALLAGDVIFDMLMVPGKISVLSPMKNLDHVN